MNVGGYISRLLSELEYGMRTLQVVQMNDLSRLNSIKTSNYSTNPEGIVEIGNIEILGWSYDDYNKNTPIPSGEWE